MEALRRTEDGEVVMYYTKWAPVKLAVDKGLPADTLEVVLRFVWPQALIQFETHHYITPAGDLLGSGLLDPKMMRYAGEFLFRSRLPTPPRRLATDPE